MNVYSKNPATALLLTILTEAKKLQDHKKLLTVFWDLFSIQNIIFINQFL